MKSFTLRISAFALSAFLFNWQPVMAGCGELCMGNYCKSYPNQPSWGCDLQGSVCYDFKCWSGRGQLDQELMAKIEKAVVAGDTNTVALLAKSIGQPIRIHDQNGIVYDGFLLAGLQGPGAAGSEIQLAQGDCASGDAGATETVAEDTAAAATSAAVVTQDR